MRTNRLARVASCLFLSFAMLASGQESPTRTAVLNAFTGDFVLAGATGDLRFDPHSPKQATIHVALTPAGFQVRRSAIRGLEQMTMPLDGTQAGYTTANGNVDTAKLRIKGKNLEITKEIEGKDFPRLPKSHIHSVESWSLSRDFKKLKVCGHADSNLGFMEYTKSGCQIYKRQ